MIHIKRTNSEDPDFQSLVKELDKDLRIRDGEDHAFFAQFNKTDMIKHVVLLYQDTEPLACGAFKHYDADTMEIKRMFVPLPHRNKGLASQLLGELESWCKELGIKRCVLETGEKQPEAIRLYHKNKFNVIPNFGPYKGIASSVCFEKIFSL
jgi:GNAT superfamily N-acetyltransferase